MSCAARPRRPHARPPNATHPLARPASARARTQAQRPGVHRRLLGHRLVVPPHERLERVVLVLLLHLICRRRALRPPLLLRAAPLRQPRRPALWLRRAAAAAVHVHGPRLAVRRAAPPPQHASPPGALDSVPCVELVVKVKPVVVVIVVVAAAVLTVRPVPVRHGAVLALALRGGGAAAVRRRGGVLHGGVAVGGGAALAAARLLLLRRLRTAGAPAKQNTLVERWIMMVKAKD